jgi:hypothetical protein
MQRPKQMVQAQTVAPYNRYYPPNKKGGLLQAAFSFFHLKPNYMRRAWPHKSTTISSSTKFKMKRPEE